MFVENWDRDYLQDQENVIGRAKVSGAPLSGGKEFTTPDFAATGSDGQPVIPADAHIRLASLEHNGGTRILRRGYSFTDGIDPQAGTLLGGLFFIAFMKNPAQFVQLQQSLARRRAERVHPAHRQRRVRLPARPAPRPGLGHAPYSPDPARARTVLHSPDPPEPRGPRSAQPATASVGSAGRGSRGRAR